MNEEIKPCPFCGNDKLEVEKFSSLNATFCYIFCRKCAAQQLWSDNITEEMAINHWNKRV